MVWTLIAAGLFLAGCWFISPARAGDPVIGAIAAGRGHELAVALSVAAFAGAQFVFMFFVADDLCPNTPILYRGWVRFTGVLEFLAALTAFFFLARAVWLVWA